MRSGVWERLRRVLRRTRQRSATEQQPLPDLDAYRQQLSQSDLELGEVRKKLSQRAEILKRLAQRYDAQADKHYRLKHTDLAEAAIRQKVKDQLEQNQWEQKVEELAQHLNVLRARQVRLEERRTRPALRPNELSDFQKSIERTSEEIHQVHMEIAIPMKLEDGEVSTFQ